MSSKNYLWYGVDVNGMRTKGVLAAESLTALKQLLFEQNISLLKAQRKLELPWIKKHRKIRPRNIVDFIRQLATLFQAGIPLLTTFNIIEKGSEHLSMQNLIKNIKDNIKSGLSLSASLQQHPKYFNALLCNLIYVGEQSGTLDLMLNHIATHQEKLENLKRKIKKALFYPAAIVLVAIAVTVVMLVLVVPQFATLFHSFGATLPLYTRFIIKLSNIIKSYGVWILLAIIISICALKYAKKRFASVTKTIDKLILQLPVCGIIIKKAIIARFAYTFAITFQAGVPLSEAFPLIANTINNSLYKQALLTICEQVTAGQTISATIANDPLFPHRAQQMIAIGEEAGALEKMLNKIAEYYNAEVDYLIDNLNNLLEPAIMVILGILIGGLIIGMYLPIFRLGTVI
ncbi:MAG: type II secretion system F family protein [Gammaproteobacteria bacterium]|nr:type II secretion system F family protein [Gammaproteobacteria bacterium]